MTPEKGTQRKAAQLGGVECHTGEVKHGSVLYISIVVHTVERYKKTAQYVFFSPGKSGSRSRYFRTAAARIDKRFPAGRDREWDFRQPPMSRQQQIDTFVAGTSCFHTVASGESHNSRRSGGIHTQCHHVYLFPGRASHASHSISNNFLTPPLDYLWARSVSLTFS